MSHCHIKPSAWATASGFWYLKPELWAIAGLSDSLWWPQLPTARLGRLKALSLSQPNTTLNATPDDNYMFAYVIEHLVNEYQHQHVHHHQLSTDSTDAALAASTPCDLSRITCFNCWKKGHYQINCPDRSTTQSTPATTVIDKSSKANQAALADEIDVSW